MTVRKSRRIVETKVHENILEEASMRMTEWMINIGSSVRSEKNHSRQENDQKGHLTLIAKLFLLLSRGCSLICVSLYACDNDWFSITYDYIDLASRVGDVIKWTSLPGLLRTHLRTGISAQLYIPETNKKNLVQLIKLHYALL